MCTNLSTNSCWFHSLRLFWPICGHGHLVVYQLAFHLPVLRQAGSGINIPHNRCRYSNRESLTSVELHWFKWVAFQQPRKLCWWRPHKGRQKTAAELQQDEECPERLEKASQHCTDCSVRVWGISEAGAVKTTPVESNACALSHCIPMY